VPDDALARRGETGEAERLAREAVAVGQETDMIDARRHARRPRRGAPARRKPDEAATALEQALERYERKGNLVSTQRAQTRLAELKDRASR
jgi:hypothetical protein